jgi:hypothetical protein
MPLPRLAARRTKRKAEVSPLLGRNGRGRERSEWRWMVVKMGDMHLFNGLQAGRAGLRCHRVLMTYGTRG